MVIAGIEEDVCHYRGGGGSFPHIHTLSWAASVIYLQHGPVGGDLRAPQHGMRWAPPRVIGA